MYKRIRSISDYNLICVRVFRLSLVYLYQQLSYILAGSTYLYKIRHWFTFWYQLFTSHFVLNKYVQKRSEDFFRAFELSKENNYQKT